MRKFTIFGRTLEQIPLEMPKKEEEKEQVEEQKSKYADMPLEEIIEDLNNDPQIGSLRKKVYKTQAGMGIGAFVGLSGYFIAFAVPVICIENIIFPEFKSFWLMNLPLGILGGFYGPRLGKRIWINKSLKYDAKIGKIMQEKVNDYDVWEKLETHFQNSGRGYSNSIYVRK